VIIEPTSLAGCVRVVPRVVGDERGAFVKTFQASVFEALGLATSWREVFYSRSARGVVRGLHFQLPPADQDKLVVCTSGRVLDVVVDLRRDSPTFGDHESVELDDRSWTMLYLPSGFAHGFAALTDDAVMAYSVSAEYAPERDTGIHWASAGIPWPFESPVVSARDAALPALADFDSPFTMPPTPATAAAVPVVSASRHAATPAGRTHDDENEGAGR
jgi:dTDP-4-dehydrorhamnose 3,5-epimerase